MPHMRECPTFTPRLRAFALKVAAPVRARKNEIHTYKSGLHDRARRAVDCAPYLTLYASGVKDWRRSFWSAVLQHRFRFDWRDDFHVGQSLVQAGPRWAVGLDDASPSNAGFAVPSGLLFCGANLAAARLPHPHLRCGFCFVKTRSLVGRAVPCPPDVSGCTDGGASRTCGTRPTLTLRYGAFAVRNPTTVPQMHDVRYNGTTAPALQVLKHSV